MSLKQSAAQSDEEIWERQKLEQRELSGRMREHGVFIKPLKAPMLGKSFMRVTTALPEDNECVIDALRKLL